MKKLLALLLACLMMFVAFTGCSEENADSSSSKKDKTSSNSSSDKNDDTSDDTGLLEPETPDDTLNDEPVDEPVEDPGLDENYPSYEEPGDSGYEEEPDDRTETEKRMEQVLLGLDEELNSEALYFEGSRVKLANVLRKAQKGEKIKMVFYGGANTAQNGAHQVGGVAYSRMVSEWWSLTFDQAPELYIKGISALTSTYACMRVEHDVTYLNPDIVVLDFAIEDNILNNAKANSLGYDNLIRKIMKDCPNTAIIGLMLPGAEQNSYTMNPKNAANFVSAARYQKEICQYYDVPVIDADTAIWDIMFDLIEVTTKTEIPLMTWRTISYDNVSLNEEGHSMLTGMFEYFFEKTLNDLSKIPTKVPAAPKKSFAGSDKYMEASMVSMDVIIEGKEEGYGCDLVKKVVNGDETRVDTSALGTYGYSYVGSKSSTNGQAPYIIGYRNYAYQPGDPEEYKIYETNPYYLTMYVPEIGTDKSYFMMVTSNPDPSKGIPKPTQAYGPITLECYNKAGELLANSPSKVGGGTYSLAITLRKFQTFQIPAGTVSIKIKAYNNGGMRLCGLGSY